MSYRKCDENLGRVLDRFDPDTPVFLYFKGGTAFSTMEYPRRVNCVTILIFEACTACGNVIPRLPVGVDGSWAWIRRSTPVSIGI